LKFALRLPKWRTRRCVIGARAGNPSITKKPAEGVRLDAILTLETDDEGGGGENPASGVTDSKGYSVCSLIFRRDFLNSPTN